MRKARIGGCLLGLVLAVAPATATVVSFRPPVPEMVAGADAVILGKVSTIANKMIAVRPTADAKNQQQYQIVDVAVEEVLQGTRGLTKVKVGVPCYEISIGGRKTLNPMVRFTQGQKACFFLKRHYKGDFYEVGFEGVLSDRNTLGGPNASYKEDLALARKCVKLLATPEKSLKSTSAADRLLTAAMLIRKYRGPALGFFGQKAPGKDDRKQEPIPAEESKLILRALAEADWSLAKEPSPSATHPANLFRRLGLTARDGWTLKQGLVNPLDGRAGYRAHLELTRAAKGWLKTHADRYRIKRFVEKKDKDAEPAARKPR
jgi:hypothetical protein